MEFDKTVLADESTPQLAKAPKEDGDAAVRESKTNGARVFGIFLILCGLATIGVCLPLFQDFDKYKSIRDPMNELGSEFAFQLSLPLWLPGTGAGMIVGGVLALVGFMNNNRIPAFAAIALALGCAGMQIYACATIRVTLSDLLVKLEGNPVSDPSFTAAEKSILDYSAAVFNHCCLIPYDSRNYTFGGDIGQLIRNTGGGGTEPVDDNQRPVSTCKATLELTCPTSASGAELRMFPEIIDVVGTFISDIYEILCHCISVESFYEKALQIIERDDLCEAYRNIVVPNADSRSVPTTSLTFSTLVLALQAFRPEYSGQLPIGEFAMVGKILPPAQVYNEPPEKIGWSCGLGYAKADAYYMYLFIQDTTYALIIGGIVIAALAAASSLLMLIFWFSGGGSSEEDVIEYENYEDVMEKKDNRLEHYNV